jgi:tryptophanyl-tRNA synthetase
MVVSEFRACLEIPRQLAGLCLLPEAWSFRQVSPNFPRILQSEDFLREIRMSAEDTQAVNRRVVSGMRPTGKLHIGHYMGALQNWTRLQSDYDCFFFVADWHALTTDYADTSRVKANILEMAFDWLAAGLDPEKATLFIQSHVPQHAELHLLLSMMTPLGWLERVPTYKEQKENLKEKDLNTYGFLGYPVLMTSDILMYQASFVPVGEDQVVHVEITREIARRFNQFYPRKCSSFSVPVSREGCHPHVFPEPQSLLTPSPKLPGTDGRKMSKSYGNSILLSDPEVEVRKKLKTMVTDPARVRRTDPGNPDLCPVGDLHKIFSNAETIANVREGCTTAGIGCIQCKGWVADNIVAILNPIQELRHTYENDPKRAWDILEAGSARARAAADATLVEVREAMHMSLSYPDPRNSGE